MRKTYGFEVAWRSSNPNPNPNPSPSPTPTPTPNQVPTLPKEVMRRAFEELGALYVI